jgi:hypothetical protein
MSVNDQLNERNVKVIASAVAATITAGVAALCIGNTLASQASERTDKHAATALVQCIETGQSATDCRVLIYGSN